MALAPGIHHHHQVVGGQIYAALIGGHQALRAGISLINAGVYVGQAAWNTFFHDANDFIDQTVDKVSDLDLFVRTGEDIKENPEKALSRVANQVSLLRRYTKRSGIHEKVQVTVEPQTATIPWRVRWHRIEGLANDEVFVVQKIRIRYHSDTNDNGWQGLIVGKPWGPFQWTGDPDELQQYPNEGELYTGAQIGINSITDFINNTRMNWTIDVTTGGERTVNYDIDLAPNFIALRSYQIITQDTIEQADQSVVMLEGKTVKWLLPEF